MLTPVLFVVLVAAAIKFVVAGCGHHITWRLAAVLAVLAAFLYW